MDKEVIGKYEACSLSGGPDSNRSDETLGVLFFFLERLRELRFVI